MASDLKPSGLEFGALIAFVAPGFVAFQGVAYQMPTAKNWMEAASQKEQSVGVFLLVLLASLSMGLVVSGVRELAIDRLLEYSRLPKWLKVTKYNIDWSKVDAKKLPLLVTIRDAHYRHYQFYSNTLVALLLWAFSFAESNESSVTCKGWVLITAAVPALLLSASGSLRSYYDAVRDLQSESKGGSS